MPGQINMEKLHLKIVQNHMSLFSGFHIVQHCKMTLALITHGPFLSIYNLVWKKWTKHIVFEEDVLRLFRMAVPDKNEAIECIILKNGKCFFDILHYLGDKDPYKPDLEINGSIVSVETDI